MPKYRVNREQLYAKSFYHAIWRLDIYVVMCHCRKRIRDFLVANHDGDSDDVQTPKGKASAYLIRRGSGLIPVIVIPGEFDFDDYKSHSTLAHEAVHVAVALHRMRSIHLPTSGCSPEQYDDEGLCYMVDWIMDECYDMILHKERFKFKFDDEDLLKK